MVWNHKCDHWIGRAYEIRQSLGRGARLHIDFPAGLFHRTGLNPIESETAPVSCDMLQPGTPFRPRKAIEWAPHANLPPGVVEFFIRGLRDQSRGSMLPKRPNGLLWLSADVSSISQNARVSLDAPWPATASDSPLVSRIDMRYLLYSGRT
jgi:hypothetical protein